MSLGISSEAVRAATTTTTYAYAFRTKAIHLEVSADIWALIPPYIMRHPKRPGWWENNNEK
ncbi:hypothetical protein [Nostoc sp. NZL]|uniref:hypothetical protein n=1 Tax=Nostoc sp. NZL TaxID=2650612 RepID=UPI0018C85DC8|nr:hypothetical protein [Nostoc sp. NZL]MBG1244752.1 hypothetical protein [Nostoc sp. NZL]